MKKFFKEINKLILFTIFLSIIMCVLTTIFLILCREWTNDILGLFVYVVVFIFDFVSFIYFLLETYIQISEFIDNKKQNKNNLNNENISTDEIKENN